MSSDPFWKQQIEWTGSKGCNVFEETNINLLKHC